MPVPRNKLYCGILFFLIGGLCLPAAATKRVTVEQLAKILVAERTQPDASFAQKLAELELSERLSQQTLSRWHIESLGSASRQAVAILAEESAFLDLPPAELPGTPAPDLPTQRTILAQTVTYISKTIPQLPNFFATRITDRFEDTPSQQRVGLETSFGYQPLHRIAQSIVLVDYRDGQEVSDPVRTSGKRPAATSQGLNSWGEFGPILSIVFVDAAQSQLVWGHWENYRDKTVAIFQYKVPQKNSHYQVNYCCVVDLNQVVDGTIPPGALRRFQRTVGYHGTLSVDPATGTVLRVTVQADLKADDPISLAEIAVEYGSVEIGGNKYVCPLKSLALSDAQVPELSSQSPAVRRSLNVTQFTGYHQFRATAHLLAEATPEQQTQPPVPSIANTTNQDAAVPSANAPAQTGSQSASAPTSLAITTSATATTPPVAATLSPPTPTPADDSKQLSQAEQESLLREMPVIKTYAREVVVDVVVTKGSDQPVLGLHQQDFAVTEDGQPQTVAFFEEHTATPQPSGTQQPLPKMPPNVYTNTPPAPQGDAVNVLLLDSLNTPQQDQARVHRQILDFFKKMQPGTQVAIFTLGSKLRFVQGFTSDPAVLLAALQDKRNGIEPQKDAASRDRSDTADDAADVARLQMMQAAPAAIEALQQAQADNANFAQGARASMTFQALNYIARYLASVPGRKNLIWFSSSFPVVIFPSVAQRQAMERSAGHGVLDRMKTTANLFTTSKVAVYPIGAGGMADDHIAEADSAGPAAPEGGGHIGSADDTMSAYNAAAGARSGTIAAMEQLAADTGGKAFFNTNDLNAAMRRAIDDGAHYYTLIYSPTNKKTDGTYRRIALKLNHGHYKLAYRRGYNADAPSALPALAATPGVDPLQPLMLLGLPSTTGLLYGVRVLPATPQPAPNGPLAGQSPNLNGPFTRYNVDFFIRSTDIAFVLTPQGEHTASIQVALVAYDRAGKPVNWDADTQAINIKDANFDEIQRSGVPAHLQIDLPDNDLHLVTGVYDEQTGKAGTLEIPLHPTAVTTTSPAPSASLQTR